MDRDARSTDIRVELAGGSVASVMADEAQGVEVLERGEIVFSTDDPWCVPSSADACRITLQRLRVELESFQVDTNVGMFELENPVLSLEAPLEVVDEGAGYRLPPDARIHTCLEVDGRSDHGSATLADRVATLRIHPISELVSVDLTWPMLFRLAGNNCDVIQGEVGLSASGTSPWAQFPDRP